MESTKRAQRNRYQRPLRPTDQRHRGARKAYHIGDLVLCVVLAFSVASVLWGYAWAYQYGYHKAETYYTEEVRHG